MKNVIDVLRSKEQEIIRVRKEVEALRTTARLLDDAGGAHQSNLVSMPESGNVLSDLDAEQPTA